jgi:hypothetical protein
MFNQSLHRRELMSYAARTMLGVSVGGLVLGRNALGNEATSGGSAAAGKAKNVIILRMRGAMTHIDTFDPKPGREEQGETKVIPTKTAGIQLGEYLPELAKLTNDMAIIRSVTTTTADHQQATYLLQTNYRAIASIVHPAMGAMANHMLGSRKKTLPDYVVVGQGERHPGAGYLDSKFTPVPVGDPNLGLQNTTRPKYLNDAQFKERLDLINKFGSSFRRKYPQKQVEAYGEFYRQAVELMSSEDLKAFDLNQEKDTIRDAYGRTQFGQGALLARRLVEHDVRWVEVSFGNWDMHDGIYEDNRLPAMAGELDNVMAALINDLKARGLLKSTLVVLASEFGRSPKINDRAGRDHHPGVFSCVLAGAGIKGGLAYGKSDEKAFRPAENAVDIADVNATVGAALGLKLDKEVISKSGRPFKFAHDGKPITAILS